MVSFGALSIYYCYEMYEIVYRSWDGIIVRAFDHKWRYAVILKIMNYNNKREARNIVALWALAELDEPQLYIRLDLPIRIGLYRHYHYAEYRHEFKYDLSTFIDGRHKGRPLDLNVIQTIARTLFDTMHQLHIDSIVHGDLKPSNIIFDDWRDTVIRNFSSMFLDRLDTLGKPATIQSSGYRSPEVILGHGYNHLADVWSLGAILYYMFYGKPFISPKDVAEHGDFATIKKLVNLYGKEDIDLHLLKNDEQRKEIQSVDVDPKIWAKTFPHTPKTSPTRSDLQDLIMSMLAINPNDRVNLTETLQSPFMRRRFEYESGGHVLRHYRKSFRSLATESATEIRQQLINHTAKKRSSEKIAQRNNSYKKHSGLKRIGTCRNQSQLSDMAEANRRLDADNVAYISTSNPRVKKDENSKGKLEPRTPYQSPEKLRQPAIPARRDIHSHRLADI